MRIVPPSPFRAAAVAAALAALCGNASALNILLTNDDGLSANVKALYSALKGDDAVVIKTRWRHRRATTSPTSAPALWPTSALPPTGGFWPAAPAPAASPARSCPAPRPGCSARRSRPPSARASPRA